MLRHAAAVAATFFGLAAVAAPALAADKYRTDCVGCATKKSYDSQEVVRTTNDIDHSRVIETQTVVPVSRRKHETNRLVVHKNLTRHVGVVRHKHTIVEKQIRYVRPRPAVTVVNYVTHQYYVVHRPWTSPYARPVYVPAEPYVYPAYKYRSRPLRTRG
jgi:hypothetical protein